MGREFLSSDSLFDLTFLSDPQVTAQGRLVAAVKTWPTRGWGSTPAGYRSAVVVVSLATGENRELGLDLFMVRKPRFSPDGSSVGFVARRWPGGCDSVFIQPLPEGVRWMLGSVADDTLDFAWHPAGLAICLLARKRQRMEDNILARVVVDLPYKQDGVGLLPSELARPYGVDLETGRRWAIGQWAYSVGEVQFAPGGRSLAVTSSSTASDASHWRQNIWECPWPDGPVRKLLPRDMLISALGVGRGAGQIAFLAAPAPSNFANQECLWMVSSNGGEPRLVTNAFNSAPSVRGDARLGDYPNKPTWIDDGTLLVNTNDDGSTRLRAVRTSGSVAQSWGRSGRVVTAYCCRSGYTAFVEEAPARPGEVFLRGPDGLVRQVTSPNRSFTNRYPMASLVGPVDVKMDDGIISYWVMKPLQERRPLGTVLEVHAGSQTLMGYGFSFQAQLLASRGFAVLFGNPVDAGTPANTLPSGIGGVAARVRRFTVEYPRQMMALVQAWLADGGTARGPIHIFGGSSGGYMTNWIVSHTDVFASAVSERSICNLVSYYGSADIGSTYTELEHGAHPWSGEALWVQSPLRYVAAVSTPVLVLHAEEDQRCPLSQAEEWFTALKRVGRTDVKMVRFPGEGHELSRSGRPDRRVVRLDLIVGWFEEHSGEMRLGQG